MNEKVIINHLKEINFVPSKKMGQNFLISNIHKEKIVESLNINENDSILEIGPGFGALTDLIIQKSNNITLIELDKRINEYLNNKFQNIKIINDDILKIDLNIFCKDNNINKIISNLPYSISAKIIIQAIQCNTIDVSVFMVQKELADRMLAKSNTKEYNSFSIILQTFCNIKKVCDVPPTCFYPVPLVNSTVITIDKKDQDLDFKKFNFFVRSSFSSKRKTIFNNLKRIYDPQKIIDALKNINLDKNIRAEKIDIPMFKNLYLEFINEN